MTGFSRLTGIQVYTLWPSACITNTSQRLGSWQVAPRNGRAWATHENPLPSPPLLLAISLLSVLHLVPPPLPERLKPSHLLRGDKSSPSRLLPAPVA